MAEQAQKVVLSTQQPGLLDTSTKRVISKSVKTYGAEGGMTQSQPTITRKITRRLVPLDDQGEEVQQQQPMNNIPPPQPVVYPVQQMVWPVAVQFNEDDALSKIREEKMLGLLDRQSDLLSNLLQKYRRLEEEQNSKMQRRIKELERENEEIWQKRRQNYLVYNVAQSVDARLREFNSNQLKPWFDQGQPILLDPIHKDDKTFFDKRFKKKKKKKKKKVIIDDGLVQDPETGELWDPKTGEIVQSKDNDSGQIQITDQGDNQN